MNKYEKEYSLMTDDEVREVLEIIDAALEKTDDFASNVIGQFLTMLCCYLEDQ